MITNAGRGAKARIMVEKWAGNFGTVQDRAQGRRTLEFDGDLFDTIDHVSLSL